MPAKSPDLSGRLPNSTNPPDCMDMTINLQKKLPQPHCKKNNNNNNDNKMLHAAQSHCNCHYPIGS